MIFETIISTINKQGKVNFAPFGIKRYKDHLYISPYIPSTTLSNLNLTKQAVINYVNDASFFVKCIVGKKKFEKKKSFNVNGYYLSKALAHDEVVVESIKDHNIRPTFKCKVVDRYSHERFEGFNRANGALIEACILASRVKILKKSKIIKDLSNLTYAIEKTAGVKEKKNWKLIKSYILHESSK
ncbi:MAG: DUF447 domain-containing protein [Alphaproteobacteria bacterium]